MMDEGTHATLIHALRLSHEVVAAADSGNLELLARLDDERLQLLKSFRSSACRVAQKDRTALSEISRLNQQALGLMEHRRRIQGRAMDLAAVGRRAVAAYATNRQRLR